MLSPFPRSRTPLTHRFLPPEVYRELALCTLVVAAAKKDVHGVFAGCVFSFIPLFPFLFVFLRCLLVSDGGCFGFQCRMLATFLQVCSLDF